MSNAPSSLEPVRALRLSGIPQTWLRCLHALYMFFGKLESKLTMIEQL
jgi:hypothetical protein